MKTKSIFATCKKCKSTILKSDKNHTCTQKLDIRLSKEKRNNSFEWYSELAKFISYKIIPDVGIKEALRLMQNLSIELEQSKNRTLPEEIYIILNDAKKPLSAQSITITINKQFGFPIRKQQDVVSELGTHSNPFTSYDGYNMWILKCWEMQY